MAAYEDTIRHTATAARAVGGDSGGRQEFARTVVAAAVIDALNGLDLQFPTLDAAEAGSRQRAAALKQQSRRIKS